MSELDDVRSLIKDKTRRLQKLKEQQAKMGISTPPEVSIEIEDLEVEIKNLEERVEQLQNQKTEYPVEFLENAGDKYREQGDWELAKSKYLEALEHVEQQVDFDNRITIARLYRKIGETYREMGDFDFALQQYEKGIIKIKTALPTPEQNLEQARLFIEQATVYNDLGNNQQDAINCANQAYSLLKGSRETSDLGDALQSLAITYRNAGEREKFLGFMDEAEEKYLRVGDIEGKIRVIGNLAIDNLHWGDYQKAIQLSKEALKVLEEKPNRVMAAKINLNLAIAYTATNQLAEAYKYAKYSLDDCTQRGDQVGEIMALAALAEISKNRAIEMLEAGDTGLASKYINEARSYVNKGFTNIYPCDLTEGKLTNQHDMLKRVGSRK